MGSLRNYLNYNEITDGNFSTFANTKILNIGDNELNELIAPNVIK